MDARLAWLTSSSSSRAELEASSSMSVLQSIYGSQVWQLPFSESSVSGTTLVAEDGSVWPERHQATKRMQRPQSASLAVLARQRRQSLQTGSGIARPQSSIRQRVPREPTSAIPTVCRTRPTTATPTLRPARPSISKLPAMAQARKPRPSSAMPTTQHSRSPIRPSVLNRPSSAVNLPEAFSDYYDDLDSVSDFPELSTPLPRDTPPVAVGTVPEYFNFWQGKPLKLRDWSVPQYGRKTHRRPKSDYGSHFYTKKNGNNTDNGGGKGGGLDGGNGMNQKNVDFLGNDQLTGMGTKEMQKKGQSSVVKIRSQASGLRGRPSHHRKKMSEDSDNMLDTRGEYAGKDGLSSTDAGGHQKERQKRGGATDTSWGGRGKLDQTDQEGDNDNEDAIDNYFDKLKVSFLGGGFRTSHQNVTRFELPMDLKTLEKMSPSDYLTAHCIISQRRWTHYSNIFSKINKGKHKFIDQKNLLWGLKEAHYNCLTTEQGQNIIELVQLSREQAVSQQLFAAICALTERIFGAECLPHTMDKEVIEVVDFEALDWKLRGCQLSQSLRILLDQL